MSAAARTNRRATTDRAVIDNRAFDVRVLQGGVGTSRASRYYRRQLVDGSTYTGPIGDTQ